MCCKKTLKDFLHLDTFSPWKAKNPDMDLIIILIINKKAMLGLRASLGSKKYIFKEAIVAKKTIWT